MKHTRKLIALAVLVACAVAACGDGSGDGGGGGYGGGGGGGEPGGSGNPQPGELTASQLGLTDGETGTAIVTAMRNRWGLANPDSSNNTHQEFYPIRLAHLPVAGTSLERALIGGGIPARFHISGGTMNVYAASAGGTTIRFDIAVIEISTGKGWFTPGANRSVPVGTDATSNTVVGGTPIALSGLTNGRISNASGLPGFEVYAVIRNVAVISSSDFKDLPVNDRNVIQIYPDPENK